MRLDWPGFLLCCHDDGRLVFEWHRYSFVESDIKHCVRIQLLPQDADGLFPWLFQLRFPGGPTSGFLVVRVDVPTDRLREAEEYTGLLRRRYAVPEEPDGGERAEAAEETGFQRVPPDAPEWLVAPAGAASEELFGAVMAHVDSD